MQRENKWQDRFDENFSSNEADWSDCTVGMIIKTIKSFMQSEIDRAVAEERNRIVEMINEVGLKVHRPETIKPEVVRFYQDAVEETKRIILKELSK